MLVRTGGHFGAAPMLLYGCRACLLPGFQGENGNRNPRSIGTHSLVRKTLPLLRVSSLHCFNLTSQPPWNVLNELHGILNFYLLRKDTFSQEQGQKNLPCITVLKRLMESHLGCNMDLGLSHGQDLPPSSSVRSPSNWAHRWHRPPRAGRDQRSPCPERCACS